MTQFLIYFPQGLLTALLGPILPDLQCLLDVSLAEISYLFLVFSVGIIPSSAVSGYLIKQYHPYILLLVLVVLQTVSVTLLLLTNSIYIVAVCVFIFGLTNGTISCGKYCIHVHV